MPYKAIFLDLDGTSLNSQHQLSPLLIAVLQRLQEQSVEIIFSTGRSFASSQKYAHEVGNCRFIINYNGAYVYDFKEQTPLSDLTLPQEIVQDILTFSEKSKKTPIFFHNNTLFSFEPAMPSDIYEGESFVQLHEATNWEKKRFTKALFIIDPRRIESMRQRAIELFPHASIVTSADNYLEIMPKDVDKSVGVKNVLKRLSLTPQDAIAFGNQLNDLGMLKSVAKGYVMENSPQLLKDSFPQSRHLGTNDEDAVAHKLIELYQLG